MDMLLFFRTLWRIVVRNSAASLIASLLIGWSSSASALWGLGLVPGIYVPQTYYKHGAVYTRAMVLSPAGNPYYVEYDSSGNEGREIAEKTGEYERAQIVAGTYYRSQLQRLADSKARYPEHEEMTAAAYRGSTFTTAGGDTIQKPTIAPNTLTVLVRAQNSRYLKDGSDLLLLELPINASVQPSATSQSILLSEAGDILHQTVNTIAFRVGFYGKDGKVETNKRRDHGSEIYGKMPNVVLSMGGFTPGGIAATDENGKYGMTYFLPACPGFTFFYTTPLYLELYYSRFNPRGSSMMPYYLVRQDYDYCDGLSAISAWTTLFLSSNTTVAKSSLDFPVDLMVVDGAASFANVKLDAKTAYNPETSDYTKTIQDAYDFDGDEKPEIIVPGKKVKKTIDGAEREVFVETAVEEAELQGIYLSSRHSAKPASTEDTAPDFTRLIDTTADFKDRGMLQSITSEDLRDTDIYVFRESTGQLVAERRGLHENELYKSYSGVDDKQGSFRFTIQLRGPIENAFSIHSGNREDNFNKWQSAGGFTEEFQKRTANHLKSGEQVRIIAINRPTGYMGSARINLNASLNGNMIDLNQARIQLTPPNLKVWAERKNKIERGMTRGEEKKQLIGNEGAGLGSDISIAIYTDWRDQDGGPLPEALADYGYTGRLAKIVAANQLAPVGANNLSQFKIKPGQQVQVIQLPEKVLAKQHLYLQVAGQPENRNPDFSTGNGEGILKYRPSKYVPVQVPLHDEQASEIARQAYRKADKEKPELNLKKPEPMYAWKYRPEMQFSLYELNIKEVRRIDAQNSIDQLYLDKKPVIANTDKLLEIYYDLLKSEFSGLDAWSYTGEKELVLALGEQEIKVTFGQDQVIKFENLEHLGALDVDDFLSLRLYTNNDQGNSLIEWAFEYLSVFADEDEEINEEGKYYYLSADNPSVEIKAVLAGYYNRREAIKKPETVRWGVEGTGSVSPAMDGSGDIGIFATTITMPPVAGNKAKVYANLQGGDAKAFFKEILVIPGEAANISANLTGQLLAGGIGELEATVLVTDRNGNIVVNGLGADLSIEGEGEIFESDGSLIGGGAKFKIRNAKLASENNTLVVRVAGIEGRFPFSVGALRVTPPPVQEVYEDQVVELKFDIAGVDASKIKPEMFVVDATKGQILGEGGTIDGDGKLVYRWHTGYMLGEAKILYSDGSGQKASLEYAILPRPETLVSEKKPLVLVSGNQAAISVNRPNGQPIEVAVPQQVQVLLKGNPAEAINLQLGDQENPNKQLLMALNPGDLGRSQFVNNGVKVLAAPGFRYQQSSLDGRPLAYNYKGYGLAVSDLPALEQAAALSGLDIVLNFEAEGEGVFFAWQDLLTFERQQDALVVKRKLDDVQIDEQRFPLPSTNELSKFKLSVQGRNFTYDLDGLQGGAVIDPAVAAREGSKVRLLAARGMGLRKFYVAARDASPLITVNGQTAGAAVLFNEQGVALLDIQLTADNLNMGYQAIPITAGSEKLTVSLYTPERAAKLLSATPDSQDFQLDAVRMLLGRDTRDVSGFSQQVSLAVRADEAAETEAQKIRALLKVFATLPEGYHLADKVDVLANFAHQRSDVFQRVLKEELMGAITGYSHRSIELSYKKMLSLLVMAELVQSDGETAEYMASSILTQSDLQLWMDWMAMPANGWVLFEPAVPYIGQSCSANVVYAYEGTADQTPYNPCRLTGSQFASWIKALMAASPVYSESPDIFLAFLDGVYNGLVDSSYTFRRDLFVFQQADSIAAYDPSSLFVSKAHAAAPLAIVPAILAIARVSAVIAKRLGKNFLKNLLKFAVGKSNSRIPPMLYLASVAYLLHSTDCEDGTLCKPLVSRGKPEEARKKITSSLVQFAKGLAFAFNRDAWRMVDQLKDNGAYRCSVLGFTHGHMYEMFMTAYYHGLGDETIVALDRNRKVPLYGNEEDAKQMISRRPDIEFKGGADQDKSNIWVELKSLSVTDKYDGSGKPDLPSETQFLRRLPGFVVPGGNAKGEPVYHRQFLLDRIAFEGEYAGEPLNINNGFRWQFHQWRPENKKLKGFIRDRYVNNGIPTRTKMPNPANGTYLDAAKERLSEAPGFAGTLTQQATAKSSFPVSGKYVGTAFVNPLFDGLGEVIDEDKLADALLKALGYSPADIADVKNKMKDAKAVAEAFEEAAKNMPNVEFGLDFDITILIPDEILEKGRDYVDMKLAGYVGCEDD